MRDLYTKVLDFNTLGFPLSVVTLVAILSILLFIGVVAGLMYLRKRAEQGNGGYEAIDHNDVEDEQERRDHMMSNHTSCTLLFRNITYSIDSKRKVILSPNSENQENEIGTHPRRVVLENIQGEVRPGEVMAIMGGSGAGKTTMVFKY
jgi:ABC-type multidrug transport system fused ATPase/permease subunit